MSASKSPASVPTRFEAGSIDRTVVRTKRTPGFTRSPYGCTTVCGSARPNITSSFEKPKMKPSPWSINTTSCPSPSSSDSSVVSSRPPNPAPSTTILIGES